MENPFEVKKSRGPKATWLLSVDAWIDSTLYESGFAAGEVWESLTIFFRKFRVKGWKRAVFELLSEGFTLGTAGAVLMLALALPAFNATHGDWRSQGDYAVTFLDRYGNEIGQRGIIQRDSVPIDEMPDRLIKAVLATEDSRFFEHYGIDFLGLARAMTRNIRANEVVQGGSTITQQLAKNLFLSNERTYERKIKEAFLAVWLEANLTKKEILQLYLDRAYMGGGTHGITAAADFYFDKNIRDVTLAEAAMLAGLFKAPTRYAPHVDLPAARERANIVLSRLVESGFMTEGQVLQARLNPATPVDRDGIDSPDYFLDWAFDEVKKIAVKQKIANHSLVARTTVDLDLQKAAEESLEFHLRQYGKSYGVGQGAIVLIENNGAVRAVVGGRDYGESQFNRATSAQRQTGSSFKTYVYTTAMENGFTPESVISDKPINWNGWSPKNYGRGYRGNVTLATALAKSINTVPVRLAKDHLGTGPIKAMAEAMGVESPVSAHKTMVLGTSGMTVMDQATGYETLATGGFAGTRHGLTQLLNRSGDVIYDFERDAPKPKRVVSEEAVKSMNTMLVNVPEWGTGRRAALEGIRAAGKTGTTQSYRDAWFCGFTGNFTAAVWFGNDDYTTTHNMTGGSLPAMTWQRLMTYAHQGVELKPIPGIENPFVDGKKTAPQIAGASGDRAPARTEAPRILTEKTTALLRRFANAFRSAPRLETPPRPETLSSL